MCEGRLTSLKQASRSTINFHGREKHTNGSISRADLHLLCQHYIYVCVRVSVCVCVCQHALNQTHASKPLTDIHFSLRLFFFLHTEERVRPEKKQQGREITQIKQ